VVVEYEGVTDTYTKYVYFVNPFDTVSGRGIGKGFIPSWEMNNDRLIFIEHSLSLKAE